MTPQHTSQTDLMTELEHLRAEHVHLRQEVADLRATRKTTRRLPRLLSRSGLVAAISLLSVLALGGVAFASIPGPTGAINGCYDKGGALYVIDSAAACPGKTTALTWNQAGVRGPQGIQGIQGPQGPQGPAGTPNPLFCPNCDMTTTTLPSNARGAYFPAARFTGSDLNGAALAFADLEGASLDLANLTNVNLFYAHLTVADLLESNLTHADLAGAQLTHADLSGSNLTNAVLLNATGLSSTFVTDVIWSNTTCPDGSNSDNDGNTCVGHGISLD